MKFKAFNKQGTMINEYLSINNAKGKGEIYIYGDITNDKWYDEDVTPNSIVEELKAMGAVKELDLHINCYGGSIDAGNAIINTIQKYKDTNKTAVTSYIDGIAASMGSNIAMVADKIVMYDNSIMMLHKPLTVAMGNSDDFAKVIVLLDKYEKLCINNYKRFFNGSDEELAELLTKESWLSADECFELGLCSEIISNGQDIVASAKGMMFGNVSITDENIINVINKKIGNKIKVEREVEMVYSKNLSNYGITEEMFNSFESSDKLAEHIRNTLIKPLIDNKLVDENGEVITQEPPKAFITVEMATDSLSISEESITPEEVLNLAKRGKDLGTDIENDAKEFIKVKKNKIDEAVTNGIKAMGDNFKEESNRKFLNSLSYDEIVDMGNTWLEQAKITLNAGHKGSTPNNNNEPVEINPHDMKLYKF